jgi:acetyl esterase/lipase
MRGSLLRWFLAGLAALAPAWGADQASPAATPAATWAARSVSEYISLPDITYLTADNVALKLDVYRRRGTTGPQPALIYIHGGGWIGGSKGGAVNLLLPWFEMGFTIVNVEYRLNRVAPAPAAVADCLCALRWVATRAQNYGIDTSRLVISGESAGGHLALTTSLIPESAALDKQCPGVPLPKVAAVVNFYGITDVADLLEGPNQKGYAVSWIGNAEDRQELARRVSPLTYVRPGLPPILSIQGDADPTVPYSHSVRLQEALEKDGVPHQLVTIAGGRHGMFTADEYVRIYSEIRAFLTKYNLLPK